MKKNNSTTMLLILGVVLSFFCSFVLGNLILGVVCFLVIFGFVLYSKRALFISSQASNAYKKDQIEKSFTLYDKAIEIPNCPPMVKIVYAYRLIHAGNVDKCAKVLGSIDTPLLNHSEKLNYNATHALTIWKQGSLHRAIEIFEALLNDKQSLLIYETLGYLHICSRNYQKALEFNLKAYEFSDTSDLIKDNLACSYYYLGYHKKAAKLYKELINDHVSFPDPYYYYALILNEREKYKAALKYLKLGLEKKESHLSELKHSNLQYMVDQIEEYLNCLAEVDTEAEEVQTESLQEDSIDLVIDEIESIVPDPINPVVVDVQVNPADIIDSAIDEVEPTETDTINPVVVDIEPTQP